jgi:FkbM family methyltransferase
MLDYYERNKGLQQYLPSTGAVFIDIGANEGAWTLPLAKRYTYVHAFEPDVRAMSRLALNLDSHGINNVVLHSEAITRYGGDLELALYPKSVHTAPKKHTDKLSACHDPDYISTGSIVVPAISLDYFVFGRPGYIVKPLAIKIDVEGGEMDVLAGGLRVLTDLDPSLFIEIHSASLHKEVTEFLTAAGYDITVVRHPDFNSDHKSYNEHLWLAAQKKVQ